jgi:hypothetical protein
MAVDQITGYIWFVFYDRRNYEDNNTDVYMALSKDGGESFTNFKISESPFLPFASTFFGDYTNVSAHNNVVRPIWNRLEGSYPKIMTALVDESAVGMEEETVIPFSLEQNSPNPFAESTSISFKLKSAQQLSLIIYDLYARPLAYLINNEMHNAGKYTYRFQAADHQLSAGVYYFALNSENHQIKKKMLLIK